MRHLYLITMVIATLILAACQQDLPTAAESQDDGVYGQVGKNYGQEGDGTVATPFKAWFYSNGGTVVDPACGAFPNVLNTQDGEGEATNLGRMTFHGSFCQNVADYLDGIQPGDSSPWYTLGHGTFTSADGDELWGSGGGVIVTTDKPGYIAEFTDSLEFVGGTGKFEGASGSVVAQGYTAASGKVDHYWSGTLILPKGGD